MGGSGGARMARGGERGGHGHVPGWSGGDSNRDALSMPSRNRRD
jgi:hypothetical protein